MATDNHSTDRLSGDTAPAASVAVWGTLLAAYEELKAAQNAFYAAKISPLVTARDSEQPNTEAARALNRQIGEQEAKFDAYVDRTETAIDAVLFAEAPDLAAVAIKLRIIVDEDAVHYTDAASIMSALSRDVTRLQQREA